MDGLSAIEHYAIKCPVGPCGFLSLLRSSWRWLPFLIPHFIGVRRLLWTITGLNTVSDSKFILVIRTPAKIPGTHWSNVIKIRKQNRLFDHSSIIGTLNSERFSFLFLSLTHFGFTVELVVELIVVVTVTGRVGGESETTDVEVIQ